jgi:hypothetical protein
MSHHKGTAVHNGGDLRRYSGYRRNPSLKRNQASWLPWVLIGRQLLVSLEGRRRVNFPWVHVARRMRSIRLSQMKILQVSSALHNGQHLARFAGTDHDNPCFLSVHPAPFNTSNPLFSYSKLLLYFPLFTREHLQTFCYLTLCWSQILGAVYDLRPHVAPTPTQAAATEAKQLMTAPAPPARTGRIRPGCPPTSPHWTTNQQRRTAAGPAAGRRTGTFRRRLRRRCATDWRRIRGLYPVRLARASTAIDNA